MSSSPTGRLRAVLAGLAMSITVTVVVPQAAAAQTAADPLQAVIPKPDAWTPAGDTLALSAPTRFVVAPATAARWTVVDGMTRESHPAVFQRSLVTVAREAARDLQAATGLTAPVTLGNAADQAVHVSLDPAAQTAPDGYRLEIGNGVRITSTTAGGVYYGTRTLIQLLRASADGRTLPRGVISDAPDTHLRMNTIDVSREFWDEREVTDVIRQMGYLKQNFLVLHFDDAEAFRLDSPRYPGLAEPGFSYDRATIERLDRIAAENNVFLVPGFEFPAHVSPKAAYWHIGMGDGPLEAEPGFGTRDTGATAQNSCPGSAYSYSHLTEDFTFNMMHPKALRISKEHLAEFMPWFSAPWVHLGGDEVPPNISRCPALQQFIADSPKYGNVHDMAIEFLNALDDDVVNAAGKRSIIYNGSEDATVQIPLDRDVIVMDWTGDGSAAHLANYDLILGTENLFYSVPARNRTPREEQILRTWVAPTKASVLGWGMHIWGDDLGWSEGQWMESRAFRPRAVVADRQWNTALRSAEEFASFGARLAAIGRAPGYTGTLLPHRTTNGRPIHQYLPGPTFPRGTYDAHTANNRRGLVETCDLSGMTILNTRTVASQDAEEGWITSVDRGGFWFGAASLPGAWTVTARIRLNGTASQWLSDLDGVAFDLSATNVTITHAGSSAAFGVGVPLNRWLDIAFVSDGANVTLYLDGVAAGTVASAAPLPRTRIRGTQSAPYMGLAELDFYYEALDAAEINAARTARPQAVCATYDAIATLPEPGPVTTPVEGGVGGTVPATLALTLGPPATFGAFTPGVAHEYTATTSANVISTAGDAALTVSDPGRLTNGAFSLTRPLQVTFSKSAWSAPVSNDAVTIAFNQAIAADEPLRTGAYSKALTFTLSTTQP